MADGSLAIVSIPIGNMSDITLRAIATLKSVAGIISEDTREAGKLLTLLELPHKQLYSYREQNHDYIFPKMLALLKSGSNLALVTDRGTPLISDPGYKLVRDLQENGIKVISVPGASAVIAAITVSGLPTDRFAFLGFLPRTAGRQKKILEEFVSSAMTLIIYESPFRIAKLLGTISEVFADCEVALVHELTKVNEGVLRGKLSAVRAELGDKKLKGEWVVLVRPLLTRSAVRQSD